MGDGSRADVALGDAAGDVRDATSPPEPDADATGDALADPHPTDADPTDPDPTDADPTDADGAARDAVADAPPTVVPPEVRGPYVVGHVELRMPDLTTDPPGRSTVGVWYPASGESDLPTMILFLFESGAFDRAPAAAGTFPLVMFSHGNNGANFQSFSLYEHLASHGFVVAAPDHAENGLTDSPDAAAMAAIATRRPDEVMRAMATVEADEVVGPMVAGTPRAISGHSFGGYTSLVLGGGVVDVPAALARCEAGSESDVFCPSLPYWDVGDRFEPPEGHERFDAVLSLAPGGYGAFGDDGLVGIDVPVMLMGGTEDEFTASDIEPLFDGLPGERWLLLVEQGGHMMFTDICRIPGLTSVPELAELCDPSTHIDTDRGWEIANTYATAFLRLTLNEEEAMRRYLEVPPVVTYEEAELRVAEGAQ